MGDAALAQSATPTPAATPEPSWWARTGWDKTVAALQGIATIIVVIGGGAWAYFKFLRGRTFSQRIELKVTGRFIEKANLMCVVATVQAKNTGLSQVHIFDKFSRVEVSVYERAAYEFFYADKQEEQPLVVDPALWTDPQPFQVFDQLSWLEPNELAIDELMLTLPSGDYIACRLVLSMTSRKGRSNEDNDEAQDVTWEATSVFERKEQHDIQERQAGQSSEQQSS